MSISGVTLENKEATVTSDEETLSKIESVVAILPTNVIITGNYSGTAPLQAVDGQGNVMPSVVTPFETTMRVNTKQQTAQARPPLIAAQIRAHQIKTK